MPFLFHFSLFSLFLSFLFFFESETPNLKLFRPVDILRQYLGALVCFWFLLYFPPSLYEFGFAATSWSFFITLWLFFLFVFFLVCVQTADELSKLFVLFICGFSTFSLYNLYSSTLCWNYLCELLCIILSMYNVNF